LIGVVFYECRAEHEQSISTFCSRVASVREHIGLWRWRRGPAVWASTDRNRRNPADGIANDADAAACFPAGSSVTTGYAAVGDDHYARANVLTVRFDGLGQHDRHVAGDRR
jgi:hypothetical protein